MENFMYIFNEAMHKLNLIGVKLIEKKKNRTGRIFYKFVGKFQFVYPVFFDEKIKDDIIKNKQTILMQLKKIDSKVSNCIQHKYTKKLRINGNVEDKLDFQYVFNIVPENITSFEFIDNKMILYVVGWGM